MIDTHLHILPGVDDGPQTLQEALALAYMLVQEGVRMAIATPHYNDEFPRRPVGEIQARVYALQQELYRQRIPLRLFPGHEAQIKAGMINDIRRGALATLNNSRYLLLELWNSTWLAETEQVVFELRSQGLIPVIAHPERNRAIQNDPGKLANLLKMGALAQLTAGSLLGKQGNSARRCAEILLKKKLIYCIASDAHGPQRRAPHIAEGLARAQQLLGQDVVYQMVEARPMAILTNTVPSFAPKVAEGVGQW